MPILLAFDGSPSARAAVQRCAVLFPDAEAVVVSVASGLANLADAATAARVALSDDMIRTAVGRLRKSAIEEARELAAAGAQMGTDAGLRVRAETLTAGGAPWGELVSAARRIDADLIACGTQGHGAVARAIVGSVSSGVVHHSGMPVLVVRAEPADANGPVLVAFDSSEPATRALTTAASLLRDGMRSWCSYGGRRSATRSADRRSDAVPYRRSARSPMKWTRCSRTRPRKEAERGAVASAVLGSVSSSLLHTADRPVLVA